MKSEFKHVIYLQLSNTSENNMAAQFGKKKNSDKIVNVIKKCLFVLCKVLHNLAKKLWLNINITIK